jgi:hypothetical protein
MKYVNLVVLVLALYASTVGIGFAQSYGEGPGLSETTTLPNTGDGSTVETHSEEVPE